MSARRSTSPAHARSMGAIAEKVKSLADLELALERAKGADRTTSSCIDTDPCRTDATRAALVGRGGAGSVGPRGGCGRARRQYEPALCRRSDTSDDPSRAATDGSPRLGTNPISWTQRRHAVARRRDAARDCARRRRKATRLRQGFEARQQVSARRTRRAHVLDGRTTWRWSRAGIRAVLRTPLGRGGNRRGRQPHSTCCKACGAKVMVYAEGRRRIQGDESCRCRARHDYRRRSRMARLRRSAHRARATDRLSQGRAPRLSPSHGHRDRDAGRGRPADGEHRHEVGLLFDTGHVTLAGGDPAAVAPQMRRNASATSTARTCAPTCSTGARPALELPRCGDQRRVTPCPATAASISVPLAGSCADAGYRGWLVVEAEQDPAVAPAYAYAKKGYDTSASLVDGWVDAMSLLVKRKRGPEIVERDAAVRGWKYVGFAAYRWPRRNLDIAQPGERDLCIVVLSGRVSVGRGTGAGRVRGEIGDRTDVFDDQSPLRSYLPAAPACASHRALVGRDRRARALPARARRRRA